MKQQITNEQCFEVSPEKWLKWAQWHFDKGYKNALPTIGQMIGFLDENGFYIDNFMEQFISKDKKYWEITYLWLDRAHVVSKTELCDALWEAVKEVLNG